VKRREPPSPLIFDAASFLEQIDRITLRTVLEQITGPDSINIEAALELEGSAWRKETVMHAIIATRGCLCI
jgi:hypothetical protein